MNARMQSAEAAFEAMLAPSLDAVVRVERAAYEHPWSYANFMDALHSGYQAQMLVADSDPHARPSIADQAQPEARALQAVQSHAGGLGAAAFSPEGADVPWGGPTAHRTLIGYFVAMKGVDEVHLLNITVAPEFQGQGWARLMLDALAIWARSEAAQWLWLEVRVGNVRAQQVYEAHGFRPVGYRKLYYPAHNGQREDAIVMSRKL